MKRVFFFIVFICFVHGASFAQRFSRDSRMYFDYGEQFRAAVYLSADGSGVTVCANTASALFSFLRTYKALQPKGAYYAVRDISIELRESPAGTIVASRSIRDTIYAHTFEETTNKEGWHSLCEFIPFDTKFTTSKLEAHFEIRDGFLTRMAFRPITIELTRRDFHTIKSLTQVDSAFIGIGDVIFFDEVVDNTTFVSNNWGRTYGFSRDIIGALPLALGIGSSEIQEIDMTLRQVSSTYGPKITEPVLITMQKFSPDRIQWNSILKVNLERDSQIKYITTDFSDSTIRKGFLLFELPGKKLEQGNYLVEIAVKAGGTTRHIMNQVELQWHDMPLSLEDPHDAIPPLQHITTETQFDSLSSGSKEEMAQKLYEFWKKRDPSPETAYNEQMAEFYKRADYAYFNFAKSPRQLDGAMTDRGKVYILYGPPTNVERSFLLGEEPTEIWTYMNKVRKIFKFTDDSGRGDYKLVQIKSM
jgi:GWxTD domain-containing protein